MDNITNVTLALRKRRTSFPDPSQRLYWHDNAHTRAARRQAAFARWVDSFRSEFYVFYRVTGVHEFKANSRVQIKLYLMPCLLAKGDPTVYPIFEKEFILYAYINKVVPYEDNEWVSVYATAGRLQRQKIGTHFPEPYYWHAEEILGKVPFPACVRARGADEETPELDSVSALRFYRFHLRFHPSITYEKRYGIIDQMWDSEGRELKLSLPPTIEPLTEATTTTCTSPQSKLIEDFNSFLKSRKSNALSILPEALDSKD